MRQELAVWILAGSATLLCGPATAGDKPYKLIGCGVTEVTIIGKTDAMTIGHNLSRGTTQSVPAGGDFDNTSYECQAVWHASGQGVEFSGRCTFVDGDGDKILGVATKSDPESKGWDWKYLGGTGKWAGITGGGRSQPLRRMPTIRPGVRGSCWEASGTYTLGG